MCVYVYVYIYIYIERERGRERYTIYVLLARSVVPDVLRKAAFGLEIGELSDPLTPPPPVLGCDIHTHAHAQDSVCRRNVYNKIVQLEVCIIISGRGYGYECHSSCTLEPAHSPFCVVARRPSAARHTCSEARLPGDSGSRARAIFMCVLSFLVLSGRVLRILSASARHINALEPVLPGERERVCQHCRLQLRRSCRLRGRPRLCHV